MHEPSAVAYFLTHPIQYQSPLLRYLSQHGVDLEVFYGCHPDAEDLADPLFEQKVQWDIPLLDGYPSEILADTRTLPDSSWARFQIYTQLAERALQNRGRRAVWIHGWGNTYPRTPFFPLAAFRAARRLHLPVLLRGDSQLAGVKGSGMRRLIHHWALRILFKQVAAFLAAGTANANYYRSFGVPEKKITLMPYAVDNAFFQDRCRECSVNREKLRLHLGIQAGSPVVLFCGRLAPEKEPALLLEAMASLQKRGAGPVPPTLVIVGDGPLRSEVERLSARCLPGTVKLAGFRNQTELPAFYDLCDIFVVPSSFEPWGLVVNEAMNAGRTVVVSNRVGAGPDLVAEGINGGIFPSGNADALAQVMEVYLNDPARRLAAGKASLERIQRWGFGEDLTAFKAALGKIDVSQGSV